MQETPTIAIIVAAGSSARMGFDKIFAEVAGKPVLRHAAEAFAAAKSIDRIIVVVRQESDEQARSALLGLPKPTAVIAGGANRAESVRFGLEHCAETNGIVAVHDGARPCVTPALIDAVVAAAREHSAAIAAVAARETVKRAKDGFVRFTENRDELFLAQTPQAFGLRTFRAAVNSAAQSGAWGESITDDSMIAERLGLRVKIVESDYTNIKITCPEDLRIAECFLGTK